MMGINLTPQYLVFDMRTIFMALVMVFAVGVSAVRADSGQINDPFESYNRAMFDFNHGVEKNVLRPVAKAWQKTPEPVQKSANNFFRNLQTPWIILNNILQGNAHKAGDNTIRFVGNTVFGVFGLFDVVAVDGPQYESADLGQTLAKWGVGEGPVFVAPIIGSPQPLRAVASSTTETLANPIINDHSTRTQNQVMVGRAVNDESAVLGVIESTEASSQDLYATTRAMLVQQRRAFVGGNELTADDGDDDPFANIGE